MEKHGGKRCPTEPGRPLFPIKILSTAPSEIVRVDSLPANFDAYLWSSCRLGCGFVLEHISTTKTAIQQAKDELWALKGAAALLGDVLTQEPQQWTVSQAMISVLVFPSWPS